MPVARALVAAVCDDLAGRGFTAVETYPEIGARPDATSAATPEFWESVGFRRAIADERFPVMRRDLVLSAARATRDRPAGARVAHRRRLAVLRPTISRARRMVAIRPPASCWLRGRRGRLPCGVRRLRTATPPGRPSGPASPQPIVVDGGLLSILPARVDGVDMQFAAETAAAMMGDPELGRSASAIVVGMVLAAGDSRGDDLAVSSVVQLRPGVFSDAFYGQWRQAYDAAACEPAGGVASHVQQLIGAHTVEVTVCSQGAHMYHTHLAGDMLVSITAVGDRKFGDLVMAGLRQ